MIRIRDIMTELNRKVLGGAKVPHQVSNPVLRSVDGKIMIANFIYLYGKVNIQENNMPRPTYWTLTEIESGNLIKEINCKVHDFSAQSFDSLYSLANNETERPTIKYFEDMDALFENARKCYLETGTIDHAGYDEYMKKLLAITPPAYRVFYEELSAII